MPNTSSKPTPPPAQLLPHAEPMVLLDEVRAWDEASIHCRSDSHLKAGNPLRQQGILSVFAGVEYAAQAMAAHARLQAGDTGEPKRGFVATASKVQTHSATLDAFQHPLDIRAQQIGANGDTSLYQFNLSCDGHPLLEGQLMVVTTD